MFTPSLQDISKNKKKIVLITGAGQGIGSEIARSFVNNGAFVLLIDYNEKMGKAQEAKLRSNARFYYCDLSQEKEIHSLAQRIKSDFKIIDVMIHNARSPAKEKNILENLEKEWDAASKVMLKHPVLLSHLLLEPMKKSTNPLILFIGSTNGSFISHQPFSYHVLKGSLSQVVRYLACEYASHKIRVNLLNLGVVDVPGRPKRDPNLFQRIIESVIPAQRAASAEEIGDMCLFFASQSANYLTGSSLNFDGGEHLKDPISLMLSLSKNEKNNITCEMQK